MENKLTINNYGYLDYSDPSTEEATDTADTVVRIISQHKNYYEIVSPRGIAMAQLTGKYLYSVHEKGGYPVVGDYVKARLVQDDYAVIEDLLPRRSLFVRKDAWNKDGVQVLAANFNTVLICTSVGRDFNLDRLERYIILAKSSGADVAIVLTKCDLCQDIDSFISQCAEHFGEIPVYPVSSSTGFGVDAVRKIFAPGKTILLLGSSGVGKSTLVNILNGSVIMETGEIDKYGRGRHTTVRRQIIRMNNGSLIVDTPGLREVGISFADLSLSDSMEYIQQLETQCKFSDCSHRGDKGCAIAAAIERGDLTEAQYRKYLQMRWENKLEDDRGSYLFEKWQTSKAISKDRKRINNRKK